MHKAKSNENGNLSLTHNAFTFTWNLHCVSLTVYKERNTLERNKNVIAP